MKIKDLDSTNYIKLIGGSIITILTILLSWDSFYTYSCMSLIFSIIVLLVISSSFISLKMHERNCYKTCYFKDESIISKMLISKILVTVIYMIISVMMSISVLYGVIEYSIILWLYIIFHIVISILIFVILNKKLKNTINEKFLHIFTRELTIKASSYIFIIAYLYITINGYEPKYLIEGNSLKETIIIASNSISSECYYIDAVLRFKIEVDSSFWWFMSNGAMSNGAMSEKYDGLKALIWMTFMIINAFIILGMNRFIVQIIYLLNLLFKEKV